MKKVMVSLLAVIVAITAALVMFSCDQDDTPVDVIGSVSFVVNGSGLGAGRMAGITPEKVVVSVEDKDGKTIFDNKVLELESTLHGYETEKLPFDKGEYRITKYLVISGTTVTYATPRTGADKADLIDKPLPFDFSVIASNENPVAPTIIGISSQDLPQQFGYTDFGYDLPDSPGEDPINVRFKLEMILGGVYYQNVDATYVVKAFDENNTEKWRQNFEYTGPEPNDFKIKDGFHRYTVEVNKWGKTLSQVFTRASLWDGRVREGVVPTTYVFQAHVEPKKVASTITWWSKVVNGETVYVPISKTTYEYQNGSVSTIRNYTWSENNEAFVDQSHSEFTYEGKNVKQILTYLAGSTAVYSEDNYTYDAEGYASHIQHKGETTTEVDLEHLFGDRLVKAKYRLSNGGGFDYEFQNQYGSMKSDRTTKGSQLCSEATYTSDKNINPLKHLGYTDYLLRNYSISNRLTESASYVGCAFPSLVAEQYSYIYDEDGYPLKSTTHFKGTVSTTVVEYAYAE